MEGKYTTQKRTNYTKVGNPSAIPNQRMQTRASCLVEKTASVTQLRGQNLAAFVFLKQAKPKMITTDLNVRERIS